MSINGYRQLSLLYVYRNHDKNGDWPNNNQTLFCPHSEGGKWKWILQDLDKCLENGNATNKLQSLIESTSTLLSTKLIVYLLNNENFKDEYITVQSLVAGSVYAPERFKTRLNEMKRLLSQSIPIIRRDGRNKERAI